MNSSHRWTRFTWFIVMAGAIGGAPGLSAQDPADRPDIVVFLADDFSQLDSAPYGNSAIRTPNIQRLADRGMTFDRAYVASPSCAPSRAALLTGMMPARNGAQSNHAKPKAELKKWPAYFHDLGYEVVAFGKVSHYKHTIDYGFDHFEHDTFHDHAGIASAVEFLKKRALSDKKRPLCLMVGSNWPHVPWPVDELGYDPDTLPLPAGSIDTPKTRQWRARYAAAVSKADEDLGKIMQAAELSLSKNTLFVFTADHGAQWPFAKWNLYESGVCVPMIVSWPGQVASGSRTSALVQWTDLLPTLNQVAGGGELKEIDGRSFVSVLRDGSQAHRERVFTTHSNDNRMNVYPARSVVESRWKYIRNLHPEYAFTTHIDLVGGALGQRDFFSTWETAAKTDPRAAEILRKYHARPKEELYDLHSDPHEQRNLADEAKHRDQLIAMRHDLDEWIESQHDQYKIPVKPRMLDIEKDYGPAGAAVQAESDKAKK